MNRPRARVVTATALAAAALLLLAAAPARADDTPGLRIQLEQKIRLVSTLIADSPAAQRIRSSGNLEAMAHLDEGRVHHALATDLLARGDLAGARSAVDEALQHLSKARRLVPDGPARQAAARQRYEQLLASLERLMDAWRARADIHANDDGQDLAAAQGFVGMARQQAQEGRLDDANRSLAQAERHVLAGMNRTLHATTLDYTLRSTSPAEEFQNELARHRGFVDLLPLAVRDLRPSAEARVLIDRYGEASRALEAQALQQFKAGETTHALESLRNATLYLQRALSAAGLAAPPPTGITP